MRTVRTALQVAPLAAVLVAPALAAAAFGTGGGAEPPHTAGANASSAAVSLPSR